MKAFMKDFILHGLWPLWFFLAVYDMFALLFVSSADSTRVAWVITWITLIVLFSGLGTYGLLTRNRKDQ